MTALDDLAPVPFHDAAAPQRARMLSRLADTELAVALVAEPSGDQVKMLARSVQSLEDAVADAGSGLLAVEVADPRTAVAVLDRLRETSAEMSVSAKGRGPLLMRVREGNTVYDVEVAPDVPVTPRMRQALRAVEGVIDVTEE